MKTCSLLTLLALVVLYTGCNDPLAGPDLATENKAIPSRESASKSTAGRLADLSLSVATDNATPTVNSLVNLTIKVHNDGPDRTSGVKVFFHGYNDSLLHIARSSSTNGVQIDSLGVWIIAHVPRDSTEQLVLTGRVVGREPFINTFEIIASEVRDPDSVPGDGDPRQDDQASQWLYPEDPPCPDCPILANEEDDD